MFSTDYKISGCTPEESRMLSEVENICKKKKFTWKYSSNKYLLFILSNTFFWRLDLSEHKIILYRKKIHCKGHNVEFRKLDNEFWKLKDVLNFIAEFEKQKAAKKVKKKQKSNIDRAFRMIEKG